MLLFEFQMSSTSTSKSSSLSPTSEILTAETQVIIAKSQPAVPSSLPLYTPDSQGIPTSTQSPPGVQSGTEQLSTPEGRSEGHSMYDEFAMENYVDMDEYSEGTRSGENIDGQQETQDVIDKTSEMALLSADDLMSPPEGSFRELKDTMMVDSLEGPFQEYSPDSLYADGCDLVNNCKQRTTDADQMRVAHGENISSPHDADQMTGTDGENISGPEYVDQMRDTHGKNISGPEDTDQIRGTDGENISGPEKVDKLRITHEENISISPEDDSEKDFVKVHPSSSLQSDNLSCSGKELTQNSGHDQQNIDDIKNGNETFGGDRIHEEDLGQVGMSDIHHTTQAVKIAQNDVIEIWAQKILNSEGVVVMLQVRMANTGQEEHIQDPILKVIPSEGLHVKVKHIYFYY